MHRAAGAPVSFLGDLSFWFALGGGVILGIVWMGVAGEDAYHRGYWDGVESVDPKVRARPPGLPERGGAAGRFTRDALKHLRFS